jgi:hypothetical protein
MRTSLVPGLIFIACTLFLSGCTKKDTVAQQDQQKIINILNAGNWVVTKYTEQGHDATPHFSGFEFRFYQNGRLFVSYAGSSIEGSWVQLSNSKRFIINLGQKDPTNTPLGALSDNWVITSSSTTKFILKDDTGTRNELLEFQLH